MYCLLTLNLLACVEVEMRPRDETLHDGRLPHAAFHDHVRIPLHKGAKRCNLRQRAETPPLTVSHLASHSVCVVFT